MKRPHDGETATSWRWRGCCLVTGHNYNTPSDSSTTRRRLGDSLADWAANVMCARIWRLAGGQAGRQAAHRRLSALGDCDCCWCVRAGIGQLIKRALHWVVVFIVDAVSSVRRGCCLAEEARRPQRGDRKPERGACKAARKHTYEHANTCGKRERVRECVLDVFAVHAISCDSAGSSLTIGIYDVVLFV